MKFYVLFAEGWQDSFRNGGMIPDDACAIEADDALKAAEAAHFKLGLTEDTQGEFIIMPMDACDIVSLGVKEVPDFALVEKPTPPKRKLAPKPKPTSIKTPKLGTTL